MPAQYVGLQGEACGMMVLGAEDGFVGNGRRCPLETEFAGIRVVRDLDDAQAAGRNRLSGRGTWTRNPLLKAARFSAAVETLHERVTSLQPAGCRAVTAAFIRMPG